MTKKGQKERVRASLLERRENLSPTRYRSGSDRVLSRLRKLKTFRTAATIHTYVSMNDRGEPDTRPLLKEMLSAGRNVVVPVMQPPSGMLRHLRLEAIEDLRPNSWGVPEPSDGKEVPPETFDLVIVPMVGGDLHCNRMGYGKGYYDRFLSEVECPAVGLLFEECLVEELPVDSFDVRLDMIVTDRRVLRKSDGARPAAGENGGSSRL